jgi:hypothetical protein
MSLSRLSLLYLFIKKYSIPTVPAVMSSSPFPAFPISQVAIPSTALTNAAYAYSKEHTNAMTVNHCLRSTAFALLLLRKFPPLAAVADSIDTEAVVVSVILHDLGWATTKSILSKDKRFEVDGANLARDLVRSHSESEAESTWDKHRLQLLWDAIALHTTPSIAHHKEPEVFAVNLGIMCDFLGPQDSQWGDDHFCG